MARRWMDQKLCNTAGKTKSMPFIHRVIMSSLRTEFFFHHLPTHCTVIRNGRHWDAHCHRLISSANSNLDGKGRQGEGGKGTCFVFRLVLLPCPRSLSKGLLHLGSRQGGRWSDALRRRSSALVFVLLRVDGYGWSGRQARLAGHNGGVHSEGVKGYIWPCLLAAYSSPAYFRSCFFSSLSFPLSLSLSLFASCVLIIPFLVTPPSSDYFRCHYKLILQTSPKPPSLYLYLSLSLSLYLSSSEPDRNKPKPIQINFASFSPAHFPRFLSFSSCFVFLIRMVSEKIVIPAGSAAAAE